ncbi:MAG: flagellar hook-associated protein FlgL [Syntrophales bacterium]
MISRVSDNIKYLTIVNNLFSVQSQYNTISEKLASQKEINRPSDDPLATSRIMDYSSTRAGISKYKSNMDQSSGWLDITESALNGVADILGNIHEMAIAQSSATASADTRQIAATSLQPLIDQIRSLANSQYKGDYIFAGTKIQAEPFSSSVGAATVGTATAAEGNRFNGTVTSSGAYTGTTNKAYVVKIVTGGTLAASTYRISSDGGKTWGATAADLSAPIALGDGIQLTFAAGTEDLAANDVFYVQGQAAGYYRGNGENLSVDIYKNTPFAYNLTGQEVFTSADGGVDIFDMLNSLKTALETNNVSGIQAQLDNLGRAQDQIANFTAECGTRQNRLDIAKTNLTQLDGRLEDLTSSIQDADVAALVTQLTNKQIALQASYELAANISRMTILDFLK